MPRSTAPRLATARRSTILRIAGGLAAIVVVWQVGRQLAGQLRALAAHPIATHPHWALVAASGALFLLAHATLVESWRTVLSCWDARLPFWSAARIWSVSNLGKYLPGKVWQIGAMGAMARELHVSPLAASGSAILGALVNILAGLVVGVVAGRDLLQPLLGGRASAAYAAIAVSLALLVAAPWAVPRVAPLIARLVRRPLAIALPARAVVYSLVGNLTAWLIYGAAFQLFVAGILGHATGGYLHYLAAYTISYVFGYLLLFAPAGLGVREWAMNSVLISAALMTAPEAALVTVLSRVWLTLLEVTPGFLFWALHAARRPPSPELSDVPTRQDTRGA